MTKILSKTVSGATQVALLAIDQKAEDARLRHLTPGIGQTLVYIEKADEASDYIAAGYPSDLSNFPHIRVEANATNKNPRDVADGVIQAKSSWVKISTQIEEIRMRAKQEIHLAQTPNDIEGICKRAVEDLAKL